MLAWPEIRSFDSVDTLQIVMHSGKVHACRGSKPRTAQRILGTLGYGDYIAAELSVMLMEQTGQTGRAWIPTTSGPG